MLPLIPMLTRIGAMILAKKYAKDKLRKKILKDAALKKKVDKIGKKASKKDQKKEAEQAEKDISRWRKGMEERESKKKRTRGKQKKPTKKQLRDAEEKRKDDAARKSRNIRLKKQVEEEVDQGFNPHYVDKLYEEAIMKPARKRHRDN